MLLPRFLQILPENGSITNPSNPHGRVGRGGHRTLGQPPEEGGQWEMSESAQRAPRRPDSEDFIEDQITPV